MATLAPEPKAEGFLQSLRDYNMNDGVFNPWRHCDPDYDIGPSAPGLRGRNLVQYLAARLERARLILVAEALGYQGGKFSGIAMTSERILLGRHQRVRPEHVFPSAEFCKGLKRTSKSHPSLSAVVQRDGFTEPTATIVWGHLLGLGLSPLDVILWNIFPFHPFDPGSGRLSNRTPDPAELEDGRAYLGQLMALVPAATLVAVGEKSASIIGDNCARVRHPARGGATEFRDGLSQFMISLSQ